MSNFSDDMSLRFMVFAINIIKLEKEVFKTYSGRHVYGQLFRAGTSAGANYEEARAGESYADFIHKLQVVLKELRESGYWLKLIAEARLYTSAEEILKFLINESVELARIIAKSIVTVKSKNIKQPQ